MKLFNFQIRANLLIYLLLFGLLSIVPACSLANLAESKNVPAAHSENNAPKTDAESSAANQVQTENNANTDAAADAAGTYTFNNHREGRGGYENSLTVETSGKGKIHVLFEGTYFFEANGAETFHETAAGGNLTFNGNVARGRLAEEGSGNGCTIELNFAGERVNLKSSNCDLNVTPDGVYKKGAGNETRADSDDSKREQELEQGRVKADEYYDPFIQYDAGAPNGIVNLMEREGEREGCGEEVLRFSGKALTVVEDGDYMFEFTLVNGNRKRQKLSLVLSSEDRLPFDDVRAIVREGNNLDVTYINCGNAPIATPTAIYKR
ncbi:MAG TPA: hypothetical protein VGC97_02910 [Pyrinomonadaceae bacterium]